MVEVTLQLSEEELKDMLYKQILELGRFDPDSLDLYKMYFDDLVDNGSGTLFYGPVNLTNWVNETLDRLTVVGPSDDNYDEVKRLWEEKKFETDRFVVIANDRQYYLVEEF